MLFGLPTKADEFWRWVYAESLVDQRLKLRSNSPWEPIVDYKEDGGALGLYLIVFIGERVPSKRPKDEVDGHLEVYHPYPKEFVNGRASITPWTSHNIRPSSAPEPVVQGRSVFRAEPGPP